MMYKVISITLAVVYAYMIFWYSQSIIRLKISKFKLNLLVGIELFIVITQIKYGTPYSIVFFLVYVGIVVDYFLAFEGDLESFFFAAGNFVFHLLCSQGIAISIVALLYRTTMYEVVNTQQLNSISLIFMFIFVIIFLFLFRTKITERNIQLLIQNKAQTRLIMMIQVVLNVTLAIATITYSYSENTIIILIYHCSLSVMMLISFYILFNYCIGVCMEETYKENEDVLKIQIQNQIVQYNEQMKYLKELRALKHDYVKQLKGFDYLLENRDIGKAKEYLNDFFTEIKDVEKIYIQYSNNPLIDAILQDTSIQANELGIEFNANVSFENTKIADIDLCTIFINLMNNAIEACQKVEGERFIQVNGRVEKGIVIIEEKNSYDGILIEEKGRIKTRKLNTEQHGFGLYSIKKIIGKYKGVLDVKPNSKDKVFQIHMFMSLAKIAARVE